MSSDRLRFGLFEFDLASGELRREGAPVHLPAQPAQALAFLLTHTDRVVTREELRDAIWGRETHVEFDRGLNFCIGQIRAALGDDSGSPSYIRTLAKRGYQFIAPVDKVGERITEGASEQIAGVAPAVKTASEQQLAGGARAKKRGWVAAVPVLLGVLVLSLAGIWWLRAARAHRRSPIVAVYRFDNETSNPGLSRFSDALTDNLVEELTTLSANHYAVVGNARILRLPRDQRDLSEAWKRLGAAYAVLGQVQTAGGETRILAHLIRLPEQTHLWVVREDYSRSDTLGIESQAANRIATEFGERMVKDSSGQRLPPLPNR